MSPSDICVLVDVPKYVGYLSLMEGQIRISQVRKPSLWFRFWVRVFFGARWVDEK